MGKGTLIVPLSISVLLHLGLGMLLVHVLTLPQSERSPEKETVLYEIFPERGQGAGRYGRNTLRPHFPSLSMKDLLLPTEGDKQLGASLLPKIEDGPGQGDLDQDGTPGDGTGRAKRAIRCSGFLGQIHRQVDEHLEYPSAFRQAEIEGFVKARLFFSPEGKLRKERIYTEGDSRFLQVYVHRLLRQAINQPFPLAAKCARWGMDLMFEFRAMRFLNVNPEEQVSFQKQLTEVQRGQWVVDGKLFFQRIYNPWSGVPIYFHLSNEKNRQAVDIMPSLLKGLSAIGKLLGLQNKTDALEAYRRDPLWHKTN